jgi:enoyl-CoA hydratase/3-hydroxyacyl-CoA dehydrogenase
MTGIPIALHAQSTLHRELGDFYTPSERLRQQVDSGEQWSFEGEVNPSVAAEAGRRMNSIVFHVALSLVEEGVGTMEDTDMGARVGLRWPKGPFERMNELGLASVQSDLAQLSQRYGVSASSWLSDALASDGIFALSQVASELSDGIATITINRPDALNALSPKLVSEFASVFDAAAANSEVNAIILRGAGKAFVAGADLKFFKDNMDRGNLGDIIEFTRKGQELFQRIDDCSKRVVVLLDGLSLGGGSELALCADVIIATNRGSMGFPETGLGIYPGLGGTQRSARRAGVAATLWLVMSGQVLGAKQALEFGLVDLVVAREEAQQAARDAALADSPPRAQRNAAHPQVAWVDTHFGADQINCWLDGSNQGSEDPVVAKLAKKIGFKAPIALRVGAELVAASARMSVAEGVAEELRRLPEVFESKDAYEGICSVLEGRRPSFTGA